ncbi:hypothetical protein V2J09_011519 [Rumex salicifolius]
MATQEDPSCDLEVVIDGHRTFVLNQRIASAFSSKLRRIIKKEKKRTSAVTVGVAIDDFPGGAESFELITRFMYNNGEISIGVSNVSVLHCSACFLSMSCLLQQTEEFLEGIFYWTWNEILQSLKSCENFYSHAESAGLIDKLICSLLAKIAQNSTDFISISNDGSFSQQDSSSSSPNSSSTPIKAWWFDDLSTLPPKIIVRVIKNLGAFGAENNSLLLTRFLLQYLKTVSSRMSSRYPRGEYSGLAETAVHGVVLMGNTAFSSCRALFGVLRVVSGFGLSKESKIGLEKLIGSSLDQAKLDDLLVSSTGGGDTDCGVYDVKLVVRLIRVFVQRDNVSFRRLKKMGWLIDQYLAEISPDRNLKVSKFIGVAQSLPDSARESFDGVYRAIDIYLESHPTLSQEERSRLCRCLNYEKLSLEACKELAKNPRIPPRVAVQALASQQPNAPSNLEDEETDQSPRTAEATPRKSMVLYNNLSNKDGSDEKSERFSEENEDMRVNIQKMQWRVVELEKLCREMKGQMTKLVRHKATSSPSNMYKSSPRLC